MITIGIIGVIAALTIPTLISNYNKKATAVRVRKTYAELVQVIKLSEIENGSMDTWDFPESRSKDNTRAFARKYILPYYKNCFECSEGSDYRCGQAISGHGVNYGLSSSVGISVVAEPSTSKKINITISVHNFGSRTPRQGRDWFYFTISNGVIQPFGWRKGLTREDILEEKVLYTCKSVQRENPKDGSAFYYDRYGCTALFVLDNWEFKNDYPW